MRITLLVLDISYSWNTDEHCHTSTGKDELLDTAMALHDAAIKDEFFVKRKLAPNVDFWYVVTRPSFCFQALIEVNWTRVL